jgi:hypothetical protein
MSKKQKRKSMNTKVPYVSQKVDASGGDKPVSISSRMMTDADFNPDYSSVIKDLKRIGILAGTFFTVLVVLSFFLR